ncbi:hypothetical protein [Spirosoma aerolatum]|uniref:hypothetical protein n=1 Tax=Spirosoma aerolatum TaxID=1211326 RepID=UPI0009AE50F0|nr:hypothetical protein [Spirosoma aerolatum]
MSKPKSEEKTYTYVISDESVNAYGFRVSTAGIDISAFEKNPVMLYMHIRGKLYGTWANLRKEDGKLLADAVFDEEDTDPEVQSIIGKAKRGVLKAASAGLDIRDVDYGPDEIRVATESILEEISLVDIPGNRNAIRLYANGCPLEGDDLKNRIAQLSAPKLTTHELQPNTPVQMELKRTAVKLGLPETATESEVEAALDQLAQEKGFKKKFEDLEGQMKLARTQERDQLINDAISDKRITADQKPTYEALFDANHEAAKVALAKIAKPVDLNAFVTGSVTLAASLSKEDLVKLYDQKDKDGSMARLKAENPAEYSRLFEAKWNRKPSA